MTVKDVGPVRWRGWGVLFWVGLACWVVGFLWHRWRPPSLWLLDVLVIPVTAVLYWFGLVAVVVGVVGGRRWVAVLSLVPVLIVPTVLVNPGWIIAPRTWFSCTDRCSTWHSQQTRGATITATSCLSRYGSSPRKERYRIKAVADSSRSGSGFRTTQGGTCTAQSSLPKVPTFTGWHARTLSISVTVGGCADCVTAGCSEPATGR